MRILLDEFGSVASAVLQFQMNSEQSSFRQIYEYPNRQPKPRRNRTHHFKKRQGIQEDGRRESFDRFVRKAKNVTMFVQKMKQQIAERHIFNMHTLSERELWYLESDTSEYTLPTCFSYDNKFILVVQCLFLVVIIGFLWSSSYELVFSHTKNAKLIHGTTIGLFLLRAVLFCFTDYKNQKQQIISDRRVIWQVYIQGKCLREALTLLFVGLQASGLDKGAYMFPLFLIIRFTTIPLVFAAVWESVGRLEDSFALTNNSETILTIVKLLFKILLFLHFLSIGLNMMALTEKALGYDQTWQENQQLHIQTNLDRYIVGWYWAATILSTVGFGDITPVNNSQRFFISILQVICCMAFGYFVNVIGCLLKLTAQKQDKYEKENRKVNRYLGSLTLSQDLKYKIRSHFLNKQTVEKIQDEEEEKAVVSSLTPGLLNTLLEESHMRVLKKAQYLEQLSQNALARLSLHLRRVIFAPEHLIYSHNTQEQKLWLLESGVIEEFTDHFGCELNKKIAHYDQQDSVVGWIRFLTQAKYSTRAKTTKLTVVYELDDLHFQNVLQEFPADRYKFLGLKQLLLEQKKKHLQKCLSCDRYTHNVIECARIHYVRKNVTSLVKQSDNLQKYQTDLSKKHKFQRAILRCSWKTSFVADNMGTANIFQQKHEEHKTLNMTIDHFIRHLTKLQSLKQLSSKKISATNSMAELCSKFDDGQTHHQEKSLASLQFEEGPILDFATDICLNEDNADYLPKHNIAQVLNDYRRIMHKQQGPLQLFRFQRK